MKTIYDLGLHEPITVNENINVLRVPGGWLYTLPNKHPVFVEMDYESKFDTEDVITEHSIITAAVRVYFKLPKDFIEQRGRDGNKPIAKFFIAKILYDNGYMNHEQISKVLLTGRSNITQSIAKVNYMLDKKDGLKNQYNAVLRMLKKN